METKAICLKKHGLEIVWFSASWVYCVTAVKSDLKKNISALRLAGKCNLHFKFYYSAEETAECDVSNIVSSTIY